MMSYNTIISYECLFECWYEYRQGKSKRRDIQVFERHLERHIFQLHDDLKTGAYQHGGYESFYTHDPKYRHIQKPTVVDRLVHHAVYKALYPRLDRGFIDQSYASRVGKGVHASIRNLRRMMWQVGRNNTRPVYALKCDIKQFFATVNQGILIQLLAKKVKNKRLMALVRMIITSYKGASEATGMPIGTVTAQLFANVYLNALDQFVKRDLKQRYYMRYMDDFIILSDNRDAFAAILRAIATFLDRQLDMQLHPDKIIIQSDRTGIDWLGYNHLPYHTVLRTSTKQRMIRRCNDSWHREPDKQYQMLQSYLGILSYANQFRLSCDIQNLVYGTMMAYKTSD